MFSFVKNRKISYIVAIILFVASILSPFLLSFHQGIDLTGGVQQKYSVTAGDVDGIVEATKKNFVENARKSLSPEYQKIIGDAVVYKISGTNDFMVEVGIDESVVAGDTATKTDTINAAKNQFFANLKNEYSTTQATISESQFINIGASMGQYIKNSGYLALTLVAIMISVYIMYAFAGAIPGVASWPFAVVTAVCLLHDVVVSFGLYVLTSTLFPEFKIDIFFITAMLTVLGYSINDTIVIMDKVRSTIKNNTAKKSLATIIDESIRLTMRRSLFTSATILVVLLAMFFFGPDAISGFILALIFGTIVGTWSSVFVAAPALVDLVDYDPNYKPKKVEEENPDGIYL